MSRRISCRGRNPPSENWELGGPSLTVGYRPEVNGVILVDVVDHVWPDDMGDPEETPMLFGAWSAGHFGPFASPGGLARAGEQSWSWPDGKDVPEKHKAFLRIRSSYVLGSGDDAPVAPEDYDPKDELLFVTKVARALLELDAALAYFNPNGEVLMGREVLDGALAYAQKSGFPPLDAWANIRLFGIDPQWKLMDTVGCSSWRFRTSKPVSRSSDTGQATWTRCCARSACTCCSAGRSSRTATPFPGRLAFRGEPSPWRIRLRCLRARCCGSCHKTGPHRRGPCWAWRPRRSTKRWPRALRVGENMQSKDGSKLAVVTGASSGIGDVFARALAVRGFDLVVSARRKDRLDELAKHLRDAHDVRVDVVPADLSNPVGVDDLLAAIETLDRPLDLLVNNAGFGSYGAFHKLPVERELAMVDLNVRALVALTGACLPAMIRRGQGAIVQVASTTSFQPVPYMAVYGATKAFVLSFSEAIARECDGTGVRVLSVCPGHTPTEFQQVSGVHARRARTSSQSAQEVVEETLEALDRGRESMVVTGWPNRITTQLPRLVPRRWLGRAIERAFRPA